MKSDIPSVALRILESTPPERITRHERKVVETKQGKRGDVPMSMVEEYRELVLAGVPTKEIRERLHVGMAKLREAARLADPDGSLSALLRKRRLDRIRETYRKPEVSSRRRAANKAALAARHADPAWREQNLARLRAGLERKRREAGR